MLSPSRLTIDDAMHLFQTASDEELMRLSSAVRDRFHPSREATYLIMAIVNYTNVCVAKCDYCSFYRLPHQSGTYLLDFEEVCAKIDALTQFGGTMVGFNGGFHPKLNLSLFAEFFAKVKNRFPQLTFYDMTVAEFMFYCKKDKLSYKDGAALMASSGVKWITGGGAEILANSFRKRHSPGKYTVEDYFDAQRAILDEGLGSTATMVIGFDESLEERMEHLVKLRGFQDEQLAKNANALSSFLCWTYKPWNNALGGKEIATKEYLRWLAVCRIYLDNIINIRTSVLTQNEKALNGLAYGANDFDLPTEDEVTQKAGATISNDFEQLLSCAKNMGFTPKHRGPWKASSSQTESLAI